MTREIQSSNQSAVQRLRDGGQSEKYLLPQKMSGFFNLVAASSTLAYGPLKLSEQNEKTEVIKNRRKFFKEVDARLEQSVFMEQVHGDTITEIYTEMAGKGAIDHKDRIQATDAMVTQEKNIFLSIVTADCVPVLFYDPNNKIIAVAHAGWKGTLIKLPQKLANFMIQEFSSQVQDILCYLGPSIGECCYSVQPDRAHEFHRIFGSDVVKYAKNITSIDLKEAIHIQLQESGLLAKHIENSEVCTSCQHHRFPSYRKSDGAIKDHIITCIGIIS